jgi:hypothetical protein
LHNARGNLIGVPLFVIRVLEKFRGHTIGVDPIRHEIVPLVPQNADELSCQRFIQQFDDGIAISRVALSHCTVLDVFACARAQRFDIGQKWFFSHNRDSFDFELYEMENRILQAAESAGQVTSGSKVTLIAFATKK